MSSNKDLEARKNEQILLELLKDEHNKRCADCGQKGTRWASWNLGAFLCIRCGGLHRKLGTHISRVKSVNLDKWTDEQVASMVEKGNAKVNALYNPNPERFPFPSYSGDMEQYIRDKYERKLFMAPDSKGMATSPRAIAPSSNYSSERYPQQMKSLKEMGFTDISANAAAINASKGNLQEAVEALLAGKIKKTNISDRTEATSTTATTAAAPKLTHSYSNPLDDLVSVFGAPPPPPPPQSKPTVNSSSILDLDEIPLSETPKEENPENSFEDEFEEFEIANGANVVPERSVKEGETLDLHQHVERVGNDKHSIKPIPPVLGNPWASNSNGNVSGDAFEDIDPFKGFS